MKTVLLTTGATNEKYIQHGIDHYLNRLKNYKPQIEYREIKIPSKTYKYKEISDILEAEAQYQLKQIETGDYLSLLDAQGKVYTSENFATKLEHMRTGTYKRWILMVGGPFGFSPSVYERAQEKVSLSAMTFTHQMVRLILLEQFYRAQSILNNQSYHH